ncbi:MAG: cytochrome ubiquinol oxidase subunit I [Archaeoglobaceae archaeon]|nr:cytochrome ubiquinol oxidase subunit I [Archaeoglobaceae archaeon]MCX8152044.1 cytochrome ubiquinol oxidase subunit I [Archaeoglobaceae archaeon]MDW8013601.1 cytochrome ubiquinol oxidase subunit I [Archaeoglobaceae archaeon]
MEVGSLLVLSAIGVYFHAIFVSITLGVPILIMMLLLKYNKTGDQDYLKAAKLMTAVLAVNFALGAITGTLVEFGLVQAWPGTILAIASFAFVPLALELIAFANEIALLVLFIVTLGRIKPMTSFVILALYWIFAVFSGVLITAVNSWLIAPWGTGGIAKALYPFMPEFGPMSTDLEKIVALKIIAITSGLPLQAIIQNPGVAEKVGLILLDPFVAFTSPLAIVSILHNIFAAFLVGTSIVLVFYAFRYYFSKEERHLKVLKITAGVTFILFLIQPTVFGHFMGESVANYNPTKFAMMENAVKTHYNPIVAFLAYGDPSKPILGFDEFEKSCNLLGTTKVGDLAKLAGLTKDELSLIAKEIGAPLDPRKLDVVWNTEVRQLCYSDLEKAMKRITTVHASYYTKISFGILGFVSAIALFLHFKSSSISNIVKRVLGEKAIVVLSLLIFLGSVIPSVFGWYVREVGRKPWTVYGLLYPEELVTVVGYARTTEFAAFMIFVVSLIAIFGIFAMYLIAKRYER